MKNTREWNLANQYDDLSSRSKLSLLFSIFSRSIAGDAARERDCSGVTTLKNAVAKMFLILLATLVTTGTGTAADLCPVPPECVEVYAENDAIPGTEQCVSAAVSAHVGLGTFHCTASQGFRWANGYCDGLCQEHDDGDDDGKKKGCDCDGEGNPCSPGSGNKFEFEQDYQSYQGFISLERSYNSLNPVDEGIGFGWSLNVFRKLGVDGLSPTELRVQQASGRSEKWTKVGGVWFGDPDSQLKLIPESGGYSVLTAQSHVERYDLLGRLLRSTDRQGLNTTYAYNSDGQLVNVIAPFGRALAFIYNDQGRVLSITTPDGVITYSYDNGGKLTRVTYPDGSTRTYHYENANFPYHLTGISDENGERFATWTYDAEGRASSSEYAGGVENVELSYHSDGTTTVIDVLGAERSYEFETLYGVPKVTRITGDQCTTCTNGHMKERRYDANGFISGFTDWNGNRTTIVNNGRGLQAQRTEAVGSPEELAILTQWHPTLRLPIRITESQRVTEFTYDDAGRLLNRTISDPDRGEKRTTTYTYHPPEHNGTGLLASVDGPRTDVDDITTYTYDTQGNLIAVTNALGHVTLTTAHDPSGRPLRIIDPNGMQSDFTFDARGRLRTITTAAETDVTATTTLDYAPAGLLIRMTFGDGSDLEYTYDAAQRLIGIKDSLGNSILYTLDAMSNVIQLELQTPGNSVAYVQTQVYNQLRRLTQSINGLNQVTTYTLDGSGNPVSIIEANDGVTDQVFDALNRLIRQVDPVEGVTHYGHDAQDQLTTVIDSRTNTTRYTYDGFGSLIQLDSPDTGMTVFRYDEGGNLVKRTDARGVVTLYRYDALNRPTGISFPSDPSEHVTYTYDQGANGRGRLSAMNDPSGHTAYRYDVRGNISAVAHTRDGVTLTTRYAYNRADKLVSMTYPSGRGVHYARDAVGRIQTVTTQANNNAPVTTLASNIQYKPFGPQTAMTYGNQLKLIIDYDNDYRINTITNTNGQKVIQNLTYSYGTTDDIIAIEDNANPANSQAFDYDFLHRLTDAEGAYGVRHYDYDLVGNRTALLANDVTTPYEYENTSNRLLSEAGLALQYDAAGNLIRKGERSFAYGANNRLASISEAATLKARYLYNGQGERVEKRLADGASTRYTFDLARRLIHETTGTTRIDYIYVNDQPLAMVTREIGDEGNANDQDNDGVVDSQDNCSTVSNPDQRDTDGDNFGNSCDGDLNNDGIVNDADLMMYRPAHRSREGDSRYNPDMDFNGDNVINTLDLQLLRNWYFNAPIPGPGFNVPGSANTVSSLNYVHLNHLAIPQALTDENATVVWQAMYTPFGRAIVDEDVDGDGRAITFNTRFPGQYFDGETGLHYNLMRYYDPTTGRYLTSDPIGLMGGLNTYSYVSGRVTTLVDPLGLNQCKGGLRTLENYVTSAAQEGAFEAALNGGNPLNGALDGVKNTASSPFFWLSTVFDIDVPAPVSAPSPAGLLWGAIGTGADIVDGRRAGDARRVLYPTYDYLFLGNSENSIMARPIELFSAFTNQEFENISNEVNVTQNNGCVERQDRNPSGLPQYIPPK